MPGYPNSEEWRPTGALRARSFIFGFAIMEREERRLVNHWQPGMVYSPGNWQEQTRWVRAPRRTMIWLYKPEERPAPSPPASQKR